MNSSLCAIETPKKKFISVKSKVNMPPITNQKRFSPSKDLLNLLDNANRIHAFQFHTEVSLTDLCKLDFINRNLVNHLSKFLSCETPDIPDVIVKLETIALEDGYYDSFLKKYISEEFCVSTEYSFCVVAILNYMHYFSISLEDALCDVFRIYSR